jgi:hypothetical protein
MVRRGPLICGFCSLSPLPVGKRKVSGLPDERKEILQCNVCALFNKLRDEHSVGMTMWLRRGEDRTLRTARFEVAQEETGNVPTEDGTLVCEELVFVVYRAVVGRVASLCHTLVQISMKECLGRNWMVAGAYVMHWSDGGLVLPTEHLHSTGSIHRLR